MMRTPHFRMGKITAAFICTILSLLVFRNISQAEISILSSKDGLSENQITAIAQDQIGRVWIGTTNGLNVFDGYSVHRIQSKALTNTKITDLVIDPSQNTMWVGTTSGLYGVHTESMRPIHPAWSQPSGNNPKQNSLRSTIKIIPHKSRNGNNFIVVFQNGQIALLRNNALHPLLKLPLTNVSIYSFATFPNGDIYLFLNKKSFRLNVASKSLIRLSDIEKDYLYINKISQYDSNQLLVSTFYKGLYLYNLSTHQITIPKFLKDFNSRNPGSMLATVDKNSTIYTVLANYQFSSLTTTNPHQIQDISAQYKSYFEGRRYNCIFVDKQNTVWIGTNKGLIKLSNEKKLFKKALQNGTDKISTRDIIQLKNKDIYVASYNGLYQYSHQNNSWQLHRKNHISAVTVSNHSLYRYNVQPYALLPDKHQKNIVIGMDGTQLLKYNIEEKQFYIIPCHFGGSAMPGVFGFAQTPSGEIKAASNIGLLNFRLSNDSILNVRLFNKFTQDQNTAVHTVKFSQLRNKIIIGTTNGLFILDTNNTIKAHFSTTSAPRLTNNDVFCFFEDKQGNIWVGTNGGGVNKISADHKTITHYINSENGLSNDIIYGIEGDNNQNLWISTFDGLNRYSPHDSSIRCYYKEQGLPTDEFNRHSSLKAADGNLYFGSINGIISFDPKSLEAIPLPAFRIFLSGITKWDMKEKSLKYDMAQPIDKDGNLKIIKHQNDMITDLHFACSDYAVVAKNKFQYRIKGITKGWASSTANNSFNINGLPFGKFLLEVRAINYRGQISENTLMIYIDNVKPLYQYWWFYALILLMISGIIYAIFTFRLYKYKSSVRLRMSIASSLHDEVGSYLTRITMIAESLNFIEKNKYQQAAKKLSKLAMLSREATASMSDVLWAVDSRNDFSGSLTDRMREHAEEMFNPAEIDLIFDFSGNNHGTRLPQVFRKELYLIYKEALHNIVKHAPEATYIKVEFNFHPNNFHLLITNDGAHTQSKEYGTGQGLKNIRKRAKAIAAHCHIAQNETNHTFNVKIFN